MPPWGRPPGADRMSSAWLCCPRPLKNPRTASLNSSSMPRSVHQPRGQSFCVSLRLNLQPALTDSCPHAQRCPWSTAESELTDPCGQEFCKRFKFYDFSVHGSRRATIHMLSLRKKWSNQPKLTTRKPLRSIMPRKLSGVKWLTWPGKWKPHQLDPITRRLRQA